MSWTESDVPDQTGRTALVTGANSGLGYHVSRVLAQRGARVLLACRDRGRGTEAVANVRREAPDAEVELVDLDLSAQDSVRRAAADVAGRTDRLDLLFNNAGVMAVPRQETVDGFELQLATNHLGHFALTGLLLPQLLAAPAGRVVTTSSSAHRAGTIDFDDLMGRRKYGRWSRYGQSNLANLLFTFELQRRLSVTETALWQQVRNRPRLARLLAIDFMVAGARVVAWAHTSVTCTACSSSTSSCCASSNAPSTSRHSRRPACWAPVGRLGSFGAPMKRSVRFRSRGGIGAYRRGVRWKIIGGHPPGALAAARSARTMPVWLRTCGVASASTSGRSS